MLYYVYHMLFEPVSQWEKFKFDLLGCIVMFSIIGTAACLSYFFKK